VEWSDEEEDESAANAQAAVGTAKLTRCVWLYGMMISFNPYGVSDGAIY
jgi:hypothetical protein